MSDFIPTAATPNHALQRTGVAELGVVRHHYLNVW
jgi:hypothetical protein